MLAKRFFFIFFLYSFFVTGLYGKCYDDISNLPVLHDGRVKPFISLAESSLLKISGKKKIDTMSSSEWLSELFFLKKRAHARNIFFIKNDDVLFNLGIKPNVNKLYSLNYLSVPILNNLILIKVIEDIPPNKRTAAQSELLSLYNKLTLVLRLTLISEPNFSSADIFFNHEFRQFLLHTTDVSLLPVEVGSWSDVSRCYEEEKFKPLEFLFDLSRAYSKDDHAWSNACKRFKSYSDSFLSVSEKNKVFVEACYIKFSPVTISVLFYFISFILFCIYFYNLSFKYLFRSAVLFFSCGILVHFLVIFIRMFITNRAPVATLFESVLFVNLILALILVVLIIHYRNHKYLISLLGCLSVVVLQYIVYAYELDGDSISVLLPVLNTNFWLTIHVVTITIGYAFCLISSVVSHVVLFGYVRSIEKNDIARNIFIINVICILSLFFSSLGTILGGIWADQSWGRFWGWDPKENGALLIVLWLTFILHFRLTSFFSPLAYLVFVTLNGVVVFTAWFGVNLLNSGLHSYGFVQNVGKNLFIYCVFEFIFIFLLIFGYFVKLKRLELKRSS